MEDLIKLPTTTRASLLSLHEYCLLEIFEFLEMEDSMNLAESCIYLSIVANRVFRKTTIQSAKSTTEKGKKLINRLVKHFGHHVRSLIINKSLGPLDWRIVKDCGNLKILRISGLVGRQIVPSLVTIDNLKEFILVNCDSESVGDFQNIIRKTKALNINCSIECNALTMVFGKSTEVKSFVWWKFDGRFNFKLHEMISNVEKLSIYVDFENISELEPLFKLNRLINLRLGYNGKSISSFLGKLAKKGIIQELHLWYRGDENVFKMLTLFDTLQLLVLDFLDPFELKSSIVWPSKLKALRLTNFDFTFDVFLSTIKQLKYLERFDFQFCGIVEVDNYHFNDVTKISERILYVIDDSDRNQRLDVVLSQFLNLKKDSSKEWPIDTERLSIVEGKQSIVDPLQIKIDFPGYN